MIVTPLFGAVGISAALLGVVLSVSAFVGKALYQATMMVAKITVAIVGILVMLMGPIQWGLDYLFDAFPAFQTGLQSWTYYLGYMQPWVDVRLFFFLMMSAMTYLTTFTIIKILVGLIRGGR